MYKHCILYVLCVFAPEVHEKESYCNDRDCLTELELLCRTRVKV